ncbi:MAG: hypothetical protein N3G20_04040, partial [Verrucomicrobiae bacterium]|nr:hypothetical protein [Verrucomicrobiae bacterium]
MNGCDVAFVGRMKRFTQRYLLFLMLLTGVTLCCCERVSEPRDRREWSIGILTGTNLLALSEHPTYRNPRFKSADIPGRVIGSVADPFLMRRDDGWFLFFEMFDLQKGRGEIGLAASPDGYNWRFVSTVLAEPFHLSYPFVFTDDNEYYMVPESRAVREVRLYR